MSREASFYSIARALRDTTERLCAELSDPLPSPPDWNEFEWDIARAVAAMQGVSVLLAQRLRWRGPPDWQRFLETQRAQGALRERRIAELIGAIDAALASAGIPVVGLKGTALRAHRLYAVGARPMGDIDLLARPEDLPAVAAALERCGYAKEFTMRRHVVFDLPTRGKMVEFGEHVDNSLKIEVHTHIADQLPRSFVDITAQLWPANPRPGINAYRDVVALLLHLLLHAAGNMRAHALRLIQLWDIAALSHRLAPDDWAALCRATDSGEPPWWSWPPLHLAQRCTTVELPGDLPMALRSACPRRLARAAARYSLYDVSWSNLRIAAFPGIEWSRTPLEALRYARSRIAPTRADRDELAQAARVQPVTRGSRWYDTSHVSRIARWIFGRPRRVQTMYSIRAALAQRARPRPG